MGKNVIEAFFDIIIKEPTFQWVFLFLNGRGVT